MKISGASIKILMCSFHLFLFNFFTWLLDNFKLRMWLVLYFYWTMLLYSYDHDLYRQSNGRVQHNDFVSWWWKENVDFVFLVCFIHTRRKREREVLQGVQSSLKPLPTSPPHPLCGVWCQIRPSEAEPCQSSCYTSEPSVSTSSKSKCLARAFKALCPWAKLVFPASSYKLPA